MRTQAGRTITIIHRGMTALVKENHEGRCVIEVGKHRLATEGTFPEAAKEALAWMLANAGEMRGDYQRGTP